MIDLYTSAAEHFDLITKPVWLGIGPALSTALEQAGEGPVLDIGAGTGLGLKAIACALPEHEIIAIEPSPSLRIGLYTRLADNPALAERVTVLTATVEEAVLPSRFGAAVGINMLGHLNPAARIALWSCLAERLSPGAPAVFTLQPPSRPEHIPETSFGETTVGRLRYSASGAANPVGEDQVAWRVTYRVHDGETLLSEQTMVHQWWTLTESQLDGELRQAELHAQFREGLVVIHKSRRLPR
ncbi:class I SAM-dependent methyltransferase [Amycolatopsis sp. NPDC049868]|uniref:class I SAM-dependent methyltransferase n=1 Tax=Amycolatopsis sp. NPDC049868 TaxID=3363934 RepID=UPI003792BDA9